jgi:nucleoside-diphosphate-sugar epimerase
MSLGTENAMPQDATPSSPELHVVFGAGQIGPVLARRLLAAGKQVRLVRRSGKPIDLDGVQLMRAEASDPAAAAEAVRGAAAVYHCMNPAYSTAVWAAELPRIQASLVAAAGRAGARLVVLDNVYALGRPGGKKLSETSPLSPCSRKGEIRARLAESLAEAVRRGDVRAVAGRASDFYGPGGFMTQFADRFWKPALAGKPIGGVVDPATPHTYHYIPDVAAGLAALGLDPGAEGTFMLPCHPAESTLQLVARFAEALGRPISLGRIPPLALKLLALAMPILREVNEMAYQWSEPFEVDDSRFRARFGDLAAPRDEAARRTVEWARATWGQAA